MHIVIFRTPVHFLLRVMGYFIYLSIWSTIFLPQEQFKNRVLKFFQHIHDHQDFTHILNYLPPPVSEYPLQ